MVPVETWELHQGPIGQPVSAPISPIEGHYDMAVGPTQVIDDIHGTGLLATNVEGREHVQDARGAIRRCATRSGRVSCRGVDDGAYLMLWGQMITLAVCRMMIMSRTKLQNFT